MPRLVERFCSETYSSFAFGSTKSSVTAFEYASVSAHGDAYSSMSDARAPSSATTTSRQNVWPVDCDAHIQRLLEHDALRDDDEQAVLPHRRVVRRELLVPADERVSRS